MGSSSGTALVLGATGGIGGAVAARLLRDGWSVRALARDPDRARAAWPTGPRQPQWVAGDAMNADAVIAAALGCDTIVHAVNPPGYRHWDRLAPPMMENAISAARAAGGARIILPGTVYNYDPATTPVVRCHSPQAPRSVKGRVRVRLEAMLEDAAATVPSLIVRAGDFFGPGVRSSWFSQGLIGSERPVRRLLNPAQGPGHSWAYAPDLADAIVRLMGSSGLAPFERVQFEGYCDVTGDGMIRAVHAALGRPVPVRAFPWGAMRLLAPFGGFPREAAEIEPFWRHPMRFDNQHLVALIGDEARTDLEAAVRATLRALDALDRRAIV